MNKRNIKRVQVGQWVRVKFDDVGCLDGIVFKKDNDVVKRLYFLVFFPATDNAQNIEWNQIVAIGDHLICKDNGL